MPFWKKEKKNDTIIGRVRPEKEIRHEIAELYMMMREAEKTGAMSYAEELELEIKALRWVVYDVRSLLND